MLNLLAMVMLCGCSGNDARLNDGREAEQVWSTRDRSIAGRDAATGTGNEQAIPVNFNRATVRESAIEVLRLAAQSTNPLLRANAIEALQHAPEAAGEVVQHALGDPNRGVRFIAAMTVGNLALCEHTALVMPLLHDESESVQAAAIYALHSCGEAVSLDPLGSMVFSDDPEVRANAVLVLGAMGNPTAIPMLRDAAGRDMPRVSAERARIVDLQIAEAIVLLGDMREIEVIRAALFAPAAEQGEVVALACQMCGRLGDRRALPNLHDLATREGRRQLPPEIRMAATQAIGRIEPGSAPVDIALFYATSERFEHRAQAAATLGTIGHHRGPGVVNALTQLLADSNPLVQISAAGGLLERLSEPESHLSVEFGNRPRD